MSHFSSLDGFELVDKFVEVAGLKDGTYLELTKTSFEKEIDPGWRTDVEKCLFLIEEHHSYRSLLTNLGARHLPEIAQAFQAVPLTFVEASFWERIMGHPKRCHELALFMRCHDGGEKLLAFAARRALISVPSFLGLIDRCLGHPRCTLFIRRSRFAIGLAITSPPFDAPSLPLPSNGESSLRRLAALSRESQDFSPASYPHLDRKHAQDLFVLSTLCHSLIDLFPSPGGIPSREEVWQHYRRHFFLDWNQCEVGRVSYDDCENESEGMMMCSRCKTVRYCSPEHQRADWKRHKLFCFDAPWAT